MTDSSATIIISQTRRWIYDFVIGESLCPFAPLSYKNDSISYELSKAVQHRAMLDDLGLLTTLMQEDSTVSDGFVIFTDKVTFPYLLQLKDIYDDALAELSLDGSFQSVAFHPEFMFSDEPSDAPGNYVNRSPFPMIHILRAEEVSAAIDSMPDIDEVPQRNRERLVSLGAKYLQDMLSKYRKL